MGSWQPARKRRRTAAAPPPRAPSQEFTAPAFRRRDADSDLQCVSDAIYTPRRVLSPTEAQVFSAIEREFARTGSTWRVMAQVNLGEILGA